MDKDLKKKIANTISHYENECEKLRNQITTFKKLVAHLITISQEHYDNDQHFSSLQKQIDEEFNNEEIEKKSTRLLHVVEKLDKRDIQKHKELKKYLETSADTLDRIANKLHDTIEVNKVKKMLHNGDDITAIMGQFSQAMALCVSSLYRDSSLNKQEAPAAAVPLEDDVVISVNVNESLQQLLDHLAIPKDLDVKRLHLKDKLSKQLTKSSLPKIIDRLKELVVDASILEQNRFKDFLQQLTDQLNSFNSFLKENETSNNESATQKRQLETLIEDDIEQIKNHIDSSKSIEELSMKVNQNLSKIGTRIKEHRATEKERQKEYETQVKKLKGKLVQSQKNADEIKALLTYQKYRVNHDSLTGLPNREAYNECILEAISSWVKDGQLVTLAVADIDFFKKINDSYGHLAGDKVLKKIAAIFKSTLRSTDFIARYGGEEFVLVFEKTNSEIALAIVEKLRQQVLDTHFYYHEKKVDVSISFGITTIRDNDNIESIFIRADEALYKAKDSGRNCSVVF